MQTLQRMGIIRSLLFCPRDIHRNICNAHPNTLRKFLWMLLLQQWWVYGRPKLVPIVGYFGSFVNIGPQIGVQNITNPSKEVCCVSSLQWIDHTSFFSTLVIMPPQSAHSTSYKRHEHHQFKHLKNVIRQ